MTILVVLVDIGLIVQAVRLRRQAKRIKSIPTSKISEITDGYREIEGQVFAKRSEMLKAPMSGKRCVYYEFTVKQSISDDSGSRSKKIVHDRQIAACNLDDGTGVASIDLANAVLKLDIDTRAESGTFNSASPKLEAALARYGVSSKGWVFNKDLRYEETILETGDELCVLGPAKVVDGSVRFASHSGQPLIVSEKGKPGILAHYHSKSSNYGIAAFALPVLATVLGLIMLDHARKNETGGQSSDRNQTLTTEDANREYNIQDLQRETDELIRKTKELLRANTAEQVALAVVMRLNGRMHRIGDHLSVNLSNTKVTDADLAQLEGVVRIKNLRLENTQVTDAGLEHLSGLTNLTSLDLRNTRVSDEGIKNLKQQLPRVSIMR